MVQALIMAVMIIAKLEIVPVAELNSKAFAVPAPWALVPKRTPRAISFSILSNLIISGPISVPARPVMITNTAAIAGMPPMLLATSMAMGVVMEWGIRLVTSWGSKLRLLAIQPEEIIAIIDPKNTPTIISPACFFSVPRYLYSGKAKAMVAGCRVLLNHFAPEL